MGLGRSSPSSPGKSSGWVSSRGAPVGMLIRSGRGLAIARSASVRLCVAAYAAGSVCTGSVGAVAALAGFQCALLGSLTQVSFWMRSVMSGGVLPFRASS
eukprot:scaffold78604_cov25-Phaeocystis_antarctica.AAC.1